MAERAVASRLIDKAVALPDGRRLAISGYGIPDGLPVLYFDGSPGSRLGAANLDRTATSLGLNLLALDRPGIGGSDPAPRRRILDWPSDVSCVLDDLGLDRVSLLGVSAGAAYVYACCRAWPGRVRTASVVSGVGPPAVMTGPRPAMVRIMLRVPGVGAAMFGSVEKAARRDPEHYCFPGSVAADRRALEDPAVREAWLAAWFEGYRGGTEGIVLDQRLQLSAWGFGLDEVATPVHLWHGEDDGVVPVGIARRVAALLPAGHLTVLPTEGHLSLLLNHTDEILGEISAD